MGSARSSSPDPKFEENLKEIGNLPEDKRGMAFATALLTGGSGTNSIMGRASGGGIPGAAKGAVNAMTGFTGGGKATAMRFAGDAMKEDKKTEQESILPATPKPKVKSETNPFSGLLLQKYNENIRKREKEAYDRSIEGIKNPNQMRQEVDQGLISTLPKPLQMMVRGG